MDDSTNFSSGSGEQINYTEDVIPIDCPSEDLLASIEELSQEIESFTAQLTGFSRNPYEAEKEALFGSDCVFTTVEQLSVPSDFTLKHAIEITDKHYSDYENIAINLIENPEKFEIDDDFVGASILYELSGNKIIEPTENRKAYFRHLELIKSIQLSAITEDNARDLITKIAYSTATMLNGRKLTSD